MTAKRLGILGGGQLGRMSAQAAAKLDIETVIFTPEDDSPASQVAAETIVADYNDEDALRAFSEKVDVISYEFENIPLETVRFLKALKPVYPDERLLEIAQDRIREKTFLNEAGIETANWSEARNVSDVENTFKKWNSSPLILKTTRFGYDGKGQVFVGNPDEIQAAWQKFKTDIVIIEEVVDFECETSVIIARDKDGHMESYGPQLNEHKNHILHKTTIPAPVSPDIAARAVKMAEKFAEAVNLRGVLGLEMFVTKDGRLLANEIAPRTHNSGHWSIDACKVSQFENHVRTVCGLPAAPQERHADAVMINLIGEDVRDLSLYERNKNAHIHLYGKPIIRAGRKMGHVTILKKLYK